MNKNFILILLVLICHAFLHADLPQQTWHKDKEKVYGRSYMFTRPLFSNVAMQQSLWHNMIYCKEHAQRTSFQVTGLYQHSIFERSTEEYFLLPCRRILTVAGDNTNARFCRDIRAEWLNLPSDFFGNMSISPEQTGIGFIMEYNQDLGRLCDLSLLNDYWISAELPVIHLKNSLKLRQFNVNQGTINTAPDAPHDIIEAFNQPAYKFARMPSHRTRNELAAITVRLGKAFTCKVHQIAFYSGIVIPTCQPTNPAYIFDASTGLNGHVGLNAGVNFNLLLNRCQGDFNVYFFFNLDDTFLIRNSQCRTLGLLDNDPNCREPKYLSRYMLYAQKDCPDSDIRLQPATTTVQGVNILTHLVRSKPFNIIDFSIGYRVLMYDSIEAEASFNVWGHGHEELIFQYPDSFFLLNKFGVQGSMPGVTANSSTIAQQGPDDLVFDPETQQFVPGFVPLNIGNIDIQSGAAGNTINYKAAASIGGYFERPTYKAFFGTGGYVDFPGKNGALLVWGVWLKAGASF